jgi:hypothetical protein
MTIPTEQTEERSLFAVSKSIAAKSLISYVSYAFVLRDYSSCKYSD